MAQTQALGALEAHRLQQDMERSIAGELWGDYDLVFTTDAGRPLNANNVTHTFHRIIGNAKLRQQRFHDLRHCAAYLLLAQGLSLREVMEVLGHSQMALTANLYTHLMPAMKKEAALRMDAIFEER